MKFTERKLNKERIRRKIIAPLIIFLLALLVVSIFSLYWVQKNNIEVDVKSKLESVQELFQEEIEENAHLLSGLLDFIKKDEVLQNAWLAGDRQALLNHAASIFEEIRTKHRVTHFYFIDQEKVCFLRVHKPDRQGDTINRFTLDRAVREGTPVYGIELGPLGTFTLRTVHPWWVGGKLAGYLELGEEIEYITAELSEILNAEVLMTIDKKYLNRAGWEKGLRFLKKTGNWEQFEKSVIIEQTMESIPSELGKFLSLTHEKRADTMIYMGAGDREYCGGFIPVFDAGKQLVGDFIVVTDVTAQMGSLVKLISLFLAGAIIFGGGLVALFYIFLGRLEHSLIESRNDLEAEIAVRKQADQELREIADYLDNIIESSLDAIIVSDDKGYLARANKSFLELIGRKEEEVLGRPVAELSITREGTYASSTGDKVEINEEFFNKAKTMVSGLFENGKVENRLSYYIRADGKAIPVEENIVLLHNKEGNVTGSVGMIRDISERKKAEKELRETKEFLESVIESSRDVIIITDEQGCVVSVNHAIENLCGFGREELIGEHVSSIVAGDEADKDKFAANMGELFEKGFSRYVVQFADKSGETVEVECNSSLIKDENGALFGGVTVVRDMREQRIFEDALKKSEEKYRSLIENANDAIVSTDKQGIILELNEKAEEMFGYSREEMLGEHITLIAIPEDKERERKALEEFNKTNNLEIIGTTAEGTGLRKDGRKIHVENSIYAFEQGGEYIITAIIRDITERKEMEEKILHSEKLNSLGELAGGVAHDFNNVLAAILGRAQLLKMIVDGPPSGKEERRKSVMEMKRGLEIIEEAARDGAETVRMVQEFSRRKQEDTYFAPVNVNELIDGALEFTRMRWKNDAEAKGIKINIQKEFLPLPLISGSASELREVFVNILNNSLDAMSQGGAIRIKTFKENSHIAIKIEDTGVGVPEAIRKRIFDPFFTTKGPQSSGLGMSVSYGIIKRHRGTIIADSNEGKGTAFTIKLPIAETAREEAKQVRAATGDARKASILVFEDEEDVRDLLAAILTKGGNEVEAVSNAGQGLKLFEKNNFDLVFTDLGMPGMTGWEVAERVKSINGRVPVILVTGWNVQLDHSEMKERWVDLVLQKPFEVEGILRLVQEGMALRERFKAV